VAAASTSPQPWWCSWRTFVVRTDRPGGGTGPARAARPGRGPARWWSAGSSVELDRDERCRLLGSVVGLCCDRRRRVRRGSSSRLWRGRAVAALRPEARHRVGQIGGARHEANAWDLERCRRVDPADPRARHIECDELDVEEVVVGQVGHILLLPGDRARPPTRAAGSPTVIAAPRSRPGRPSVLRLVAAAPWSRGPSPRLPARPR
jgi:hypothetical protein